MQSICKDLGTFYLNAKKYEELRVLLSSLATESNGHRLKFFEYRFILDLAYNYLDNELIYKDKVINLLKTVNLSKRVDYSFPVYSKSGDVNNPTFEINKYVFSKEQVEYMICFADYTLHVWVYGKDHPVSKGILDDLNKLRAKIAKYNTPAPKAE